MLPGAGGFGACGSGHSSFRLLPGRNLKSKSGILTPGRRASFVFDERRVCAGVAPQRGSALYCGTGSEASS